MSGPSPSPAVLPASITRVVLTGFMGAGKSTVGALLAERLGWSFLDSDRLIESRAGITIADIFAQQGEAAFRQMEAAAVREAASGRHVVLALGGGALEIAATRELLASLEESLIVFLEAPLDTLVSRCSDDAGGAIRPVLADRGRLEDRWRNRQPWYRQAHLTIATAELAPRAVVDQIVAQAESVRAGATR